jgi:hypothetical protein
MPRTRLLPDDSVRDRFSLVDSAVPPRATQRVPVVPQPSAAPAALAPPPLAVRDEIGRLKANAE